MHQSLLGQLGYKIVQELKANSRFSSYMVTKDGQSYFFKQATDIQLEPLLETEVWWNLTVSRLSDANPRLSLRAPHTLAYASGWYISEYFDAPLLVSEDHCDAQTLRLHVDRIVSLLVELDNQLILGDRDRESPLNYTDELIARKIDSWSFRPMAAGLLSQEQIVRVKSLLSQHRASLTPTLAHGDFVPWHMFDLGDRIGLVDGEHASLIKPRYYDLVYLYARVWTTVFAPDEAVRILKLFLDNSQVDRREFAQIFLPMMAARAVGTLHDALNDLERSDQYQKDYRHEAQDLLNRALSEDLEAFLGV